MPILAVALLLGAAVAHATWNYVAKGAQSSASFMFVFCTFAAIVWMHHATLTKNCRQRG